MADPNIESILANLLWSRVKAEDAPCSSDQHWCSAIEALSQLIPEYAPTDPELAYEFRYALLNQEVLFRRMTSGEAIAELDKYEAAALEASFVPPEFWADDNLKHPLRKLKNNESIT